MLIWLHVQVVNCIWSIIPGLCCVCVVWSVCCFKCLYSCCSAVPSIAPPELTAIPLGPHSLQLSWKPLAEEEVRGELVNYTVRYHRKHHGHRPKFVHIQPNRYGLCKLSKACHFNIGVTYQLWWTYIWDNVLHILCLFVSGLFMCWVGWGRLLPIVSRWLGPPIEASVLSLRLLLWPQHIVQVCSVMWGVCQWFAQSQLWCANKYMCYFSVCWLHYLLSVCQFPQQQ